MMGLIKKNKKPKTAHTIQMIFIEKEKMANNFQVAKSFMCHHIDVTCITVFATARQISANRNYRRQSEQLIWPIENIDKHTCTPCMASTNGQVERSFCNLIITKINKKRAD